MGELSQEQIAWVTGFTGIDPAAPKDAVPGIYEIMLRF